MKCASVELTRKWQSTWQKYIGDYWLFYENVTSYVKILEFGDEPSKEDKLESVIGANKEFNEYFYPNRVYVPPDLYTRIKELADALIGIANDFTRAQRQEERGRASASDDDDYWMKALMRLKKRQTPCLPKWCRKCSTTWVS